MAYTTVELVRQTLSGADTSDGGTAAELSDQQIEYEIRGVTAGINASLRNVYKVPFDTDATTDGVPDLIIQIATDISVYACDLNYRKGREYDNQNMPIPLRYLRAQTLLENLRSGTITLDWDPASDRSGAAGVFHHYSPALMTFGDIFNTGRTW